MQAAQLHSPRHCSNTVVCSSLVEDTTPLALAVLMTHCVGQSLVKESGAYSNLVSKLTEQRGFWLAV